MWLITGASSGLGLAITEAALGSGDLVAATARNPGKLEDLAARHPGRLLTPTFDVTDADQIDKIVTEVLHAFGRIDVLVNNAGRALVGAVEETTDRELRDLMELHFFGPAALTRAVLPHLRANRAGAIVQISSIGGRLSFPGVSAYSATKFALEGFSEALVGEIAPFGITVLIVEPGALRTGLHGPAMQSSAELPAYADIVGPVRTAQTEYNGTQPGDPVRAAQAVLTALTSSRPPLRLPLGNDAADALRTHQDKNRAEFRRWEALSRSIDYSG
ncbi:oxidoreductase [Microlunatus parietis]